MRVLGIVCSPGPPGRTSVATETVLRGAEAAGGSVSLVHVKDGIADEKLLQSVAEAQALVLASPTYRAEIAWPLKSLLDHMPRGFWGETSAPLQGKVCATVVTGASDHHFLGGDGVRAVLSSFFAVQLLSPGLYISNAHFIKRKRLDDKHHALALTHGRALVDLAAAVTSSASIQALRPLV